MTGHAPRKDTVVHLRSWLVPCSASVKATQPAAIPRTEHDMDTASDTSSDNSGTDMSDSDNC